MVCLSSVEGIVLWVGGGVVLSFRGFLELIMSIRKKIAVLVGFGALSLVILALLGFTSLSHAIEGLDQVVNEQFVSLINEEITPLIQEDMLPIINEDLVALQTLQRVLN